MWKQDSNYYIVQTVLCLNVVSFTDSIQNNSKQLKNKHKVSFLTSSKGIVDHFQKNCNYLSTFMWTFSQSAAANSLQDAHVATDGLEHGAVQRQRSVAERWFAVRAGGRNILILCSIRHRRVRCAVVGKISLNSSLFDRKLSIWDLRVKK